LGWGRGGGGVAPNPPNPQSPIPNPQSPIPKYNEFIYQNNQNN